MNWLVLVRRPVAELFISFQIQSRALRLVSSEFNVRASLSSLTMSWLRALLKSPLRTPAAPEPPGRHSNVLWGQENRSWRYCLTSGALNRWELQYAQAA